MTDFELPLAGGQGTGFFMLSGMMMIVLATVAGVLIYKKRRRLSF